MRVVCARVSFIFRFDLTFASLFFWFFVVALLSHVVVVVVAAAVAVVFTRIGTQTNAREYMMRCAGYWPVLDSIA